MKKIVYLLSNIDGQGGIQRVLSLLSNKLIDEYNITIISIFKCNSGSVYKYDNRIKIVYLFNEEGFDLRLNFIKVYFKLRKVLKKIKYDKFLVQAAGLSLFCIGNVDLKQTVVVEHVGYSNSKKFGLGWFGRKVGIYLCVAMVVITKRDLELFLKKERFISVKKIHQIYNPLDKKIQTHNYQEESKKIIACGRLAHEKGFDLLLKSCEKIFIKYPEWKLELYGEGPERERLIKLSKDLDIEKNVFFKGYKQNIYNQYKNYSFLVVPSRFESFGMSIIEAMKVGIPVISFDCPDGPREIIEDSKNGLLVKNGSIEELVTKMEKMISDVELRKKIRENALLSLENYKLEKITEKWKEILNENEKK